MNLEKSFPASIGTIVIEQLAAKVTITANENVKDIQVDVVRNEKEHELIFEHNSHQLTIRGKGETIQSQKYNFSGNNIVINMSGSNIQIGGQTITTSSFGSKDEIEIEIQVPAASVHTIQNKGAVDLHVEGLAKLQLKQSGQGDVVLYGVQDIDLNVSGQGDVSIKEAHSVRGRISGQGDIEIVNHKEPLMQVVDITISGMGDLEVQSDIKDLRLRISGMGDVLIRGQVEQKDVVNTGMGSIRYKNA